MQYENFGDVSPKHGQIWICDNGGPDFAPVVEILGGADIGLADNQYRIERGSVYFAPRHWDSALNVIGYDTIGPPDFFTVAYAFNAYGGFDRDTFGGFEIVQVGKTPDDWTARGTTCECPDTVLHGNACVARYLRDNYLC